MSMKLKTIFGLVVFLTTLSLSMNAKPVSALGTQNEISKIAKKVYPSVVKVEARNSVRKVATGVVIDKNGNIVTTALISPRDEEIFITTSDGKRIEAEFLGMDEMTHLALIKVKDKRLVPITMGEIDDLSPGSWVGVVSISIENKPAITQGIVSSMGEDSLRLNVWVIGGASGSPVVDNNGRMVGLLRGVYSDVSPVAFEFREREVVGSGYVFSRAEAPSSGMCNAIPIDIVKHVTSEIAEKGKVERGWLGIGIAENDDGDVEIVDVDEESPAELAGLQEGDIILQFDGKDITSPELLVKIIRKRKPGDKVTLKIERDGKKKDVKVKLGERTKADIFKEFELKFPRLFPSEPGKMLKAPKIDVQRFFPQRLGSRKYIGVYLEELTEELSGFFGVKEGRGLLVAKFGEDSPAEKAGLKVGDVIVKADGKTVEAVDELSDLIQEKEEGEKIEIEFIRDKKKKTVEVEIEEERREGAFLLPGEWNEYVKSWGNYTDNARLQYEKYQDKYSKEYKENMEKMKKEMERLSEQATKSARRGKENAEKVLKKALRKYRGIKV